MPSEQIGDTRSIGLNNLFESAVYEHVAGLR